MLMLQVMEESEMYKEGWGKTIFQEASSITQAHIQQIWKQEAEQRMASELREKAQMEQFERGHNASHAQQPHVHGPGCKHGHDHSHGAPASTATITELDADDTTPVSVSSNKQSSGERVPDLDEDAKRKQLEEELLREEEDSKSSDKGKGSARSSAAKRGNKKK
eukprot:jgi/Hompol1/578/HPOL_004170-RA